jgi:hypothetical protein
VLTRLRERVLVCGNLLTWGPHGVALADGEPAEELWTGVAEALYRIRRAEKLAGQTDLVMIKDLPHDELAGAAPMRRFSYATLETEPNMVLDLAGIDGFEAYLARLNKKYRKAAKEIARDVEAAGLTVEPLRGMHARGDALHRLYLDVHEHAQVRVATFPSGYLPGLERALGPDAFRCTVIRRGDELVAFETTLRDGDTAIGYYIGFDKQLNQSVPLYFRLLQCVAADAIDLGCARVSLGRTALEPKARLGGQPAPLAVLVRHRVPAFNALLRVLLRGVEFEGPPERNPFK